MAHAVRPSGYQGFVLGRRLRRPHDTPAAACRRSPSRPRCFLHACRPRRPGSGTRPGAGACRRRHRRRHRHHRPRTACDGARRAAYLSDVSISPEHRSHSSVPPGCRRGSVCQRAGGRLASRSGGSGRTFGTATSTPRDRRAGRTASTACRDPPVDGSACRRPRHGRSRRHGGADCGRRVGRSRAGSPRCSAQGVGRTGSRERTSGCLPKSASWLRREASPGARPVAAARRRPHCIGPEPPARPPLARRGIRPRVRSLRERRCGRAGAPP